MEAWYADSSRRKADRASHHDGYGYHSAEYWQEPAGYRQGFYPDRGRYDSTEYHRNGYTDAGGLWNSGSHRDGYRYYERYQYPPPYPRYPIPSTSSSSYGHSDRLNYSQRRGHDEHNAPFPSGGQGNRYQETFSMSRDRLGSSRQPASTGPHQSRPYSTRAKMAQSGEKRSYIRSKPRERYHHRTFEPPANYPMESEPPGPLPLLVLDLNGTLVNRGAFAKGSASDRSRRPILRPYLKSFLQYCLGVQGDGGTMEQHFQAWDERDAKRGSESTRPHGSHFWSSDEEPQGRGCAKFRLLLWSSAQPHNVDSMARAILSPEQAEQLLRVYARDTLVTKRLFYQKAPSVKDLEILWAVLNSKSIGPNAEARLLTEARDGQDRTSPDEDEERGERQGKGASDLAAELAEENVLMPRVKTKGQCEDGRGYGQHNTLLLDDSVDKARLQPFNHILLPEFDQRRAAVSVKAAKRVKAKEMREGSASTEEETGRESDDDNDQDDRVDDVLLQVVGVLEHARYQVNISSWVRFGGLGNFGGMAEQHPYYLDEEANGMQQVDDGIIEKAARYFAQSPATYSSSATAPRLHTSLTDRTEGFWVQEGIRALQLHHIPLQRF